MYRIKVNGRVYRYATLQEAKRVAEEIFQATGIVIGIEEEA